MNSRKTVTCYLFQLPQDIFRVIFQYLSVYDLMKGEEAFLINQELLSLYRSSLEGFALKEEITNLEDDDELISWIIDHKLLVEKLELHSLIDLEMNLLNQSRSSLRTIDFSYISSDSDNSAPVIPHLGHFPLLTSVTFYDSNYFTNDELLSFFSHNPQLEIVEIEDIPRLSNEITPHISNYCPKIKVLSLSMNDWVNNETVSLLTQQRLFPNLKSIDIQETRVTNQESLRQFILSRPLLSGLILPYDIDYSKDFLVFYLRHLIFPSILSQNNDLESHSLAISSLVFCIREEILNERDDVVTPEIFSLDILSHIYRNGCPVYDPIKVFFYLSKFPSMIDSIIQSQFIPFILDTISPNDLLPIDSLVDLLFHCDIFNDHFPLLVEKYLTHPSSLIWILHQAIQNHFSDLSTEELQTMILIVLNVLQNEGTTKVCLDIISKLLREPSSQLLVDPNSLLSSFKSTEFSTYHSERIIECLNRFISLNENYQQAFIESNLLPQIMTRVELSSLKHFTKHCLLSSGDGLLVDHLVDIGWFQYLLSNYSQGNTYDIQTESLFELLIIFNNNKYSETVREMELPKWLREKLFEKREDSLN